MTTANMLDLIATLLVVLNAIAIFGLVELRKTNQNQSGVRTALGDIDSSLGRLYLASKGVSSGTTNIDLTPVVNAINAGTQVGQTIAQTTAEVRDALSKEIRNQ